MTYDFNVKIRAIEGEEIDRTLAKILSEFIGTETKGHTIKLYGWMQKLQSESTIELDEADKKTFIDMIENTDRLFVNIKGQIFDILK